MTLKRRLPIGAEIIPQGGVSFRVWAPKCQKVEVAIVGSESLILNLEPGGYYSGIGKSLTAGSRYSFKLDGSSHLFPDPASRYQPEGVHGPSEVVDPSAYQWNCRDWKGITSQGQVLYELHIGTFSPEGTWAGAISRLKHLKRPGHHLCRSDAGC